MSNPSQQEAIKRFIAEIDPPVEGAAPVVGVLPATLPASPAGYTKHLVMHLNFGRAGGGATYAIKDPEGNETVLGYQYDTRKDGITGFSIDGVEQTFETWSELAAYWPEFVKARAA